MSRSPGAHASQELITSYVLREASQPPERMWALETHLDDCARCRQRVAEATATQVPDVAQMLDGLWPVVEAAAVGTPAPSRSRLLRHARRWAPPSVLPWLLMSVLVVGAAMVLDLLGASGHVPSLVLLLGPVAPLAAVAAAWSGRLDPMAELTMASPRAGLAMVLRRTAAVLAVLIPTLAAAGGLTGVSWALSLLPGLAFTLGALALGSVVGVDRAATALGSLWTVAVVLPSLFTTSLPVLLAQASVPLWALAAVIAALITALRAGTFATTFRSAAR